MAHRLGVHLLRPAVRTTINTNTNTITISTTTLISLSTKHPALSNPLLKSFHSFSKSPRSSTKLSFALPSLSLLSRSYSNKATVAIEDAQSLVEREHFGKVRQALEQDPRKKITYKEYEAICAANGLTSDQAKQLAQSLSDSGIILYFGNSSNAVLRDCVYLKPADFNKTVSRIIAQLSDDSYIKQQVATKQAEVDQLKKELQPMQEKRVSLERKAHRTANTYLWMGFGYCVIQAAIVARLTWWELSWDVMEPVTYMLTFAVVLISYSYFVMTGSEYTFEGLRKTLEKRKLIKLIRRSGFNEEVYVKLQNALQIRQEEVSRLLEEIEQDPVSLHLKNPEKPVV